MNKSPEWPSRATGMLLVLSIGLYVFSLTQYGLLGEGGGYRQDQMGWQLLVFGFFTINEYPAWLANPILFTAWILSFLGKHRPAAYFSVASLLLMLSALLIETIDIDPTPIVMKVTGYGIGYYSWLASAVTLLAGNAVFALQAGRERN